MGAVIPGTHGIKPYMKTALNLSCNFQAIFKFRGICSESDKMDTDYILLTESIEPGKYTFQGLAGLSSIIFNKFQFNLYFSQQIYDMKVVMHIFKNLICTVLCFWLFSDKKYWIKSGCLTGHQIFGKSGIHYSELLDFTMDQARFRLDPRPGFFGSIVKQSSTI